MKLNRINNSINTKNFAACASKDELTPGEKENTESKKEAGKLPNNPSYWQNQYGVSFGKNPIDFKNYLDKNGFFYSTSCPFQDIADICIDKETKEINPIAFKYLDKFYFSRNINILRHNLNSDPSIKSDKVLSVLKALCDNEGNFNKENYASLAKIQKRQKVDCKRMYGSNFIIFNCPNAGIENIVGRNFEDIDILKDENGIIDKKLLKFALKLVDLGLEWTAYDILKVYKEKGDEQANSIKERLTQINKNLGIDDEYDVWSDFAPVANSCLKEDGSIDEEKMDFAEYLMKYYPLVRLHEDVIDLGKNKDSADFAKLVLKINGGSLYPLPEIYKNHADENGVLHPFVKNILLEKLSTNKLEDIFTAFSACNPDKSDYENFDFETFNKTLELISLDLTARSGTINKLASLLNNNTDVSSLGFKDKTELLNVFEKAKNIIASNKYSPKYIDIDFLEEKITELNKSISISGPVLPISKKAKTEFIHDVMASRNDGEFTRFEEVMKNSIPLLKEMKTGLKISYPREEFLLNLNEIADTKEKIERFQEKTGANLNIKDDKVIGWEGIITLDKLDKNSEFENKIYETCHKFFYENEVQTDSSELNLELNKIIKACPEFINTIGKKQHGTHEYPLDIHQLLVLANSIDNPEYKKLNPIDKTILKTASIFHDAAKLENTIDKAHPLKSSLNAISLSKKFIKNPENTDRIYELIKNHHWLNEYATAQDKQTQARKTAWQFRRPRDFEIAKIMAKSDLMAVSDSFYNSKKAALEENQLEAIQKNLDTIHSTGCAILSDYIINKNALNGFIETKDGIQYKTINLHKIKDNEDMGKYGFRNGIKKQDLKFLVHMVDECSMEKDLKNLEKLTSPVNGGVLSESLITPKYNRTYGNRKYGVLLSQINSNIVNINSSNQGSGRKKESNNIDNLVFLNNSKRSNFKNKLLKNLEINEASVTDYEFSNFYKNAIASKTSILEFNDNKNYKLGSKIFTGSELKNAIMKFQDDLIVKDDSRNNEIVGYIPKIQAVVAKSKNLDSVPKELLNFANLNDLPVILI